MIIQHEEKWWIKIVQDIYPEKDDVFYVYEGDLDTENMIAIGFISPNRTIRGLKIIKELGTLEDWKIVCEAVERIILNVKH
ncbi:hypothetical protein EVB32_045 [Rhizobium phage RHph_TM39]|uniref:Uncharacterized protein n=1 Tax=Rhizobium phage RHph_TM30 TaxID=2509764 RepID=A0A7S5R531_9CAUD|nr:hypothetical protein PQC16_gp045 [Rhizobium phage RHph_TM30]QIG71516.1 hypothetical protein EVB94_045 [Rhizobium phage RHph_TM40]QIG71879.1 hypothetical protein EVB95_045 [Rhizobium phage RHph_TM2_3B]QIG72241.1 hypothetical protein EVB96_045 [Rhizobium phage RHph_TM3_3_6]QIG77033.1 hypothetical protein EVB32_045 [Rhizobium phage RHph_TM39]QIG77373.1 hypothetical protein EVB61_045 [Rhizobium phage RHph_TM21B]QIG77632.1 hypothetical protein EVB64_045 [Rhizobium phage RHph_TM61]